MDPKMMQALQQLLGVQKAQASYPDSQGGATPEELDKLFPPGLEGRRGWDGYSYWDPGAAGTNSTPGRVGIPQANQPVPAYYEPISYYDKKTGAYTDPKNWQPNDFMMGDRTEWSDMGTKRTYARAASEQQSKKVAAAKSYKQNAKMARGKGKPSTKNSAFEEKLLAALQKLLGNSAYAKGK